MGAKGPSIALERTELELLLQVLEIGVVGQERIRDMLRGSESWDRAPTRLVRLKELQQWVQQFAVLGLECDELTLIYSAGNSQHSSPQPGRFV